MMAGKESKRDTLDTITVLAVTHGFPFNMAGFFFTTKFYAGRGGFSVFFFHDTAVKMFRQFSVSGNLKLTEIRQLTELCAPCIDTPMRNKKSTLRIFDSFMWPKFPNTT